MCVCVSGGALVWEGKLVLKMLREATFWVGLFIFG